MKDAKEEPVHDELDAAIAAYRADLLAEVDLGADDLAEVEDHLRALVGELRAAGRSADLAFAEAVRRLGEPAAIAREYARVRPAFGARLSRARAWSAAALIVPFLVIEALTLGRYPGLWSAVSAVYLSLSAVVLVALIARLSWGRAIALGNAAAAACHWAFWFGYDSTGFSPLELLLPAVAVIGFLAPWRRRDLSAAGWALALCAFAYASVVATFVNAIGHMEAVKLAPVALAGYLVGAAGVLLRARWGSVALAVSAVALAATAWPRLGETDYLVTRFYSLAALASAAALAAAAWLSWRTARDGLGTLRGLAA